MAKESGGTKKMIKSKNLIGVTTVFLITLICCATPAQAALISVVPECQIVSKGEYFTVDIYADPEGNETVAGSYNLYFNNTLLNATSQVNGTFLSQDGAPTGIVANIINNTCGVVSYGEYRQVSYGVTNPGVLATITFEALADGFCELSFGNYGGATTELIDVNITPIPTDINNGSVRIDLCGDVNNNGTIDTLDWRLVRKRILDPNFQLDEWAADVNNDGPIDTLDWRLVRKRILDPEFSLNCRCGA